MPLLFSYGTLQEEHVQLSTFGRCLQGHPDELMGYEPCLVKITDAALAAAAGRTHYPNVTFTGKGDNRVPGTLFEISDAELIAADGYEEPAEYQRVVALVASGKQAWLYVYVGSEDG